MAAMIEVSVAYARPGDPLWMRLEVPDGSNVAEVLEASGLLQRCPEIDLANVKIGVFGKLRKLDAVVEAGERVEVYRPIIADPKTVPRRTQAA